MKSKRTRLAAALVTLAGAVLAPLLAGCGQEAPATTPTLPAAGPGALVEAFPATDVVPGWSPTGEARAYNRDSLFDLVNGQAESFFAYAFEEVAVQRYENAAGTLLDIEIWRLATPTDAYGLFGASFSGKAVAIGNGGDSDPDRRLAFWQERYYVRVRARQAVPDAELWTFAGAVSAALPAGGSPPALLERLPPDGLVGGSVLFFHEEISFQDRLWLGGQNLLGLSAETDGVLAQYEIDGQAAHLLLIRYAHADAASIGLVAVNLGGIEDVLAADTHGELLGVVLGSMDTAVAQELLSKALGK